MQWGETKTDDDDDAHLLKNICMWEQGGQMWVEPWNCAKASGATNMTGGKMETKRNSEKCQ